MVMALRHCVDRSQLDYSTCFAGILGAARDLSAGDAWSSYLCDPAALQEYRGVALDKMDAWGLNNESMKQDSWDYVHITTWNFLPCLLRRVGAASGWAVKIAYAAWGAAIAALAYVCWTLVRVVEW